MRPRPPATTEPRPEPRAGTVTAITAQAQDPERVSVFLDGAFAFGLPALVAHDEGLRLGDLIDAARAAALVARDEAARATSAAVAFLGYRPRSEKEVRDRLRQKGYATEAVDQAVAKVAGWGYLDDANFARLWVDGRSGSRGRRLLEQELRHKGVERETAREALDEAALDELGAALEAGRKRLRQIGGADPAASRRRLGAYLVRRGYGYDTVRTVLERLLGEADETGLDLADHPDPGTG